MKETLTKILRMHPDWWLETTRDGISKMWSARFAEYPSTSGRPSKDNTIFLEVEKTLGMALEKILKRMKQDK